MRQRAEMILELLSEKDYISVDELSERLTVSEVTIRKDLTALEKAGLLRRTHGGAIPVTPQVVEEVATEQNYDDSAMVRRAEKRAIATVAADYVQNGQTVAFTGGSTATEVARNLRQNNLTIITNAINIALELSHRDDMTIFVPGGFLRGGMYSLVSVSAVDRIRNFNIDVMFVGINGIHAERGLTELLNDQAVIHSALIEQSRTCIVVADHSKLGKTYKAHMADLDEVDLLITDSLADADQIATFRERGLQVVLASLPEK